MIVRAQRLGAAILVAAIVVSGCAASRGGTSSPPASAEATETPPEAAGPKPGMNASGEVVDSSLIQSGSGKTVTGRGGWEGEITGKPFPGSKFTKLEIGMPRDEVERIVGPPTDEGAYVTAKAFIPFYYGSDTNRVELAYKGQGRLVFAHDGSWGPGTYYLTWIIYNENDSGIR